MEKQLEYFDLVSKTQKQVISNALLTQKTLQGYWFDGAEKVKSTVTKLPGVPDTPQVKEAVSTFNGWFDQGIANAKTAIEEGAKLQEGWLAAIDKQTQMQRDFLKGMLDLAKPATPAKSA